MLAVYQGVVDQSLEKAKPKAHTFVLAIISELTTYNPLVSGVQLEVIDMTKTYILKQNWSFQLSAIGLFKYIQPFSGL